MRTLLDERFAPITSAIGFIELPLREAADAMETWQRRLYENVRVGRPTDGFPSVLHRLEPLQSGTRPRELMVAVGDKWTAYFDCGLRGTDAEPPIGHLTDILNCRGLVVKSEPDTIGREIPGRYGVVQFTLFGPENDGHFLNYVRTVQVLHDTNRWVFTAIGPPQPFEDTEAYTARRIRDRFTSDMLERYCQALGIDVFNDRTYGPEAVLFETSGYIPQEPLHLPPGMHGGVIPNPPGPRPSMTLAEAQTRAGIVPGAAVTLPG